MSRLKSHRTSADNPRIPEHVLSRRGARTTAEVPNEVRELLHAGRIESVNLSEWLIVDHTRLVDSVFPNAGWDKDSALARERLAQLDSPTAMKRSLAVGLVLAETSKSQRMFQERLDALAAHTSDTVRGWGCMMVGAGPKLSLAKRLTLIKPFARDTNMSVRELAWMGVRSAIAEELEEAIALLTPWAQEENENLRRFASESTRPRGVWCKHIDRLKEEPELALPLLEPLQSDPSLYVRNSVANWLNDASKSRPDFVKELCERWRSQQPNKATDYIVRRALRTLTKKEER